MLNVELQAKLHFTIDAKNGTLHHIRKALKNNKNSTTYYHNKIHQNPAILVLLLTTAGPFLLPFLLPARLSSPLCV
jgi:hypothetical protein